jgi:hypothetical protein
MVLALTQHFYSDSVFFLLSPRLSPVKSILLFNMSVRNIYSPKHALFLFAVLCIISISVRGLPRGIEFENALSCIPSKDLEPLSSPETVGQSIEQNPTPKFAVVTFNTQETSYTVLSLKNKQSKYS